MVFPIRSCLNQGARTPRPRRARAYGFAIKPITALLCLTVPKHCLRLRALFSIRLQTRMSPSPPQGRRGPTPFDAPFAHAAHGVPRKLKAHQLTGENHGHHSVAVRRSPLCGAAAHAVWCVVKSSCIPPKKRPWHTLPGPLFCLIHRREIQEKSGFYALPTCACSY